MDNCPQSYNLISLKSLHLLEKINLGQEKYQTQIEREMIEV